MLPKTDNLFQFQAQRIQENKLAIDLLALKPNGVTSSTSKLLSDLSPTLSSHTNTISVINAAAHAQSQLGKLGLKKILPLLERRPNDIGLVLTIVQLYILTKNPGSATTVLESLLKRLGNASDENQDILHSPGLIATLVSLYSAQNRASQVKSSLARTASYWRHKSKPPLSLLQAAGLTLLSSSSAEHASLATDIFSTLHALDPSSSVITAGYVAAKTSPQSSNPQLPTKEIDSLPPIARLISTIDVPALEAAGVPSPPPPPPLPSSTSLVSRKRAAAAAASDQGPNSPKKRIRQSRLPKDHDPAQIPDPERWLPVRDRASYRPKGKRGRAKAAALTQGGGAVSGAAEKAGGGGAGAGGGGGGSGGGVRAGKVVGGEGVIRPPAGGAGKGKKKKGKK